MKCTIFKNIHDTRDPYYVDVLEILQRIKNGASKEKIELIRSLEEKDERNEIKKQLPSICFSGRFSERNAESLLEYSGLICLDIDEVKKGDMNKLRETIENDEHCFGCFVSPSGNGYKIIVKVAPYKAEHKGMFLALEVYFNELLHGYQVDKSGKDLSRVCYESYDPDCFYNEDSEIWSEVIDEKPSEENIKDSDKIIALLKKWIDREEDYVEGNRNNHISKFIYACCRFGVPDYVTRGFIINNYPGFPPQDLEGKLKSCYKKEMFGSESFTQKQLNSKSIPLIEEKKEVTEFWTINDKGAVRIDTKQFLRFIEAYGYGIYRPKDVLEQWDFVRVLNMIVDIVSVVDIKRDVLKYVEKHAPEPVFDHFQMKNRYFEKSFLNALKNIEIDQVKDTADTSLIFFENFYYEITAEKKEKKNYIDLKGAHIWRSQICKKNIEEMVDWRDHDFPLFLFRALGKDEVKFSSAMTAIGYGIHTYKKRRLAKLIYACDESKGELDGMAMGGSGKNIWMECLKYCRSVADVDGKDFDKNNRFKFQSVKDDTQIVLIDDYESDLKELFTKITGIFGVERKGKDLKVYDFEHSPKIFVSANVSPKGFSTSFARRMHVLEFSSHYNDKNTPADEFGEKDMLSNEWDQSDFDRLYSFLFDCSQKYFKEGLISIEMKDGDYKAMIKNTGRDFTDYWINQVSFNMSEWQRGRDVYDDFIKDTGNIDTHQKFYRKCRIMCGVKGWTYEEMGGTGANKKIKFVGFSFEGKVEKSSGSKLKTPF